MNGSSNCTTSINNTIDGSTIALRFGLNQKVALAVSGELGTIVGLAVYTNSAPAYYVRYKAADGRQVEGWWNEDALAAA